MSILIAVVALSGQAKPVTYPFKQLEAGGFSRQRTAKVFVIRSAGDYQAYNTTLGRVMATPKVDWKHSQLLAVHIGSAPSTGYGLVVKRIVRESPASVVVEAVKIFPPQGTMQAMHVTYPYVIVRTPKFEGRVTLKVQGE